MTVSETGLAACLTMLEYFKVFWKWSILETDLNRGLLLPKYLAGLYTDSHSSMSKPMECNAARDGRKGKGREMLGEWKKS